MYQKTVEFITFVLIIQEKFTLSIYTMFTKTNGQLPNIDYDDGQNRLVDKVVLQVSVQQQKQPDQAGRGSHHKQIETDERKSGDTKMPEILGQKFCFRIVSKMTQNIYFPFGQDAPKLKKEGKIKSSVLQVLCLKRCADLKKKGRDK